MLNKLKIRFASTRRIKNLLENPVDLEIFKQKPSPKFFFGLYVMGFSYLIGWPMISALSVLAVYFKNPLIFAIGSPVAYGLSHLFFLLSVFITGKDAFLYMNALMKWTATKGLQTFLGKDVIAQVLPNKPPNVIEEHSTSNQLGR